jgi:hypothetical protein
MNNEACFHHHHLIFNLLASHLSPATANNTTTEINDDDDDDDKCPCMRIRTKVSSLKNSDELRHLHEKRGEERKEERKTKENGYSRNKKSDVTLCDSPARSLTLHLVLFSLLPRKCSSSIFFLSPFYGIGYKMCTVHISAQQ